MRSKGEKFMPNKQSVTENFDLLYNELELSKISQFNGFANFRNF